MSLTLSSPSCPTNSSLLWQCCQSNRVSANPIQGCCCGVSRCFSLRSCATDTPAQDQRGRWQCLPSLHRQTMLVPFPNQADSALCWVNKQCTSTVTWFTNLEPGYQIRVLARHCIVDAISSTLLRPDAADARRF